MINIFGITEVSVWATLAPVNLTRLLTRKAAQYVPPLGDPMPHTTLALRTTDRQLILLHPVPRHAQQSDSHNRKLSAQGTTDQVLTGQLLIGGKRQCRLNDETEPQVWRETGDLVRVVRGKVYYLGRAQESVLKVRGKKINLLEISNTLQACPAVNQVV